MKRRIFCLAAALTVLTLPLSTVAAPIRQIRHANAVLVARSE
jgi:hypothetical protein